MATRNRVNFLFYLAGALTLLALFEEQALELGVTAIVALAVLEALYGAGIALFVTTDYRRRMARTLSRMRRQLAQRLANFDPNASFSPQYFMQRLQQECDRSRRYELPLTLLVLRFHPKSGAAGTQRMAASIAADVFTHVAMAMRREDVMGQLAELDYGIYLPHTAREGAAIVTQRLVDALQEYMPTVGVAVYGEDGFSGSVLLMAALRNGEGSYNREEVQAAWNGTRVTDY